MSLADALAKSGFSSDEEAQVTAHLSTGYPVLDERLSGKYQGGGFPQGRMSECAGPSSSGKTAIASNVMACAQQQGGLAVFMDHEKSFSIEHGKKAFHLTENPDHWLYFTPYTYEESWDKVKEILYLVRGVTVSKEGKVTLGTPLLPYDKPVVVVFDSLASMTPQQKFIKSSDAQGMNDALALAKLTSQTFDVMATICEMTNTTFLFLNQIRTKPGVMYGDDTVTPGGNAPEFYFTSRLRLGKTVLYDKETKTKYGTKIGCEVVKNKGWKPFGKCEWEYHFLPDGSGKFDVIGGVIEELKKLGKLTMSGAYINWDGKKYYKDKLVEIIEKDGLYPTLLAMLPTSVTEDLT